MVLAAGKGTRMKSELPKPLHAVCGKPMIDHVLAAVSALNPERTVVVIGAEGEPIRERLPRGIEAVLQQPQLGTGHAARCGADALAGFVGDVLITCADIPLLTSATMARLVTHHREQSAAATVLTMRPPDPTGYGRVVRDASGAVRAIVEDRDADEQTLRIGEVNTSVYCFDAAALSEALTHLTPANAQQEYYLTDVIGILAGQDRPVAALATEDPDEVMGINTRVQLARAERIARDRVRERVMLEGATLLDPASTLLDADVQVGVDTVIGPGCSLLGNTVVGSGCELRSNVVLRDAVIGDRVLVRDHTVVEASTIGCDSAVGPFSLVRGDSRVGERCKVGASAEINRSRLGDGSKMQHFSYLGDSEVGKNCNIGAGAVTCNYDGITKHHTTIEDEAFIGSNAVLIAPVRVGRGAYVAAGSVVSKDVPPGALAIERGKQKNIEEWAARRRERQQGREDK